MEIDPHQFTQHFLFEKIESIHWAAGPQLEKSELFWTHGLFLAFAIITIGALLIFMPLHFTPHTRISTEEVLRGEIARSEGMRFSKSDSY